MFTEAVSYPAALAAGLLSFFSPCVLPLIPAYFTFITGYSLEELTGADTRQVRIKVLISTVSFVLGFSVVFILMGASASYLGGLMYEYSDVIRIAGGVFIIILGVHLTGVIPIKSLYSDKRFHLKAKPLHAFGTFLVGMAFGAGWSPCIGPMLGSILIIAGNQDTIWKGVLLLSVYSVGLAVPFLLISLFINYFMVFIKKATRAMKYFNPVAGALLICAGLLLVSDKLMFVIN